ncbi:hypothetical protein [Streptomyces lasiicapitis]|uniref:Uncharacterized protein n=1 Tax=Streptomyces lasiicapitis TaxID=1923961 RepID=A0ABQ2MU25_9ACTN|nr:hypothetical protein [Streptomyces lasiicapitis]GGO58821.1 hypothetical protein GCM10012286_78990 [Streptomyces lasiicapitis]
MADVWVLDTPLQERRTSILVRADAITYLSCDRHKLIASRLESEETVALAQEGTYMGKRTPPLPENFHTALLAAIGQARKQADTTGEDQVLMAETDDHDEWSWGVFPLADMAV